MKPLLALGLMIALLAIVAAPQVKAGSATEINATANATLQSFVDPAMRPA
jgi:hypothetical protein